MSLPSAKSFRCGFIASLLLLLTGLGACSYDGSCYHRYRQLPESVWQKSDTVRFSDSLRLYADLFSGGLEEGLKQMEASLKIRHDDRYPYRDLHFSLEAWVGTSQYAFSKDFAVMAAGDNGRWSGKGWGSLTCLETETFTLPIDFQAMLADSCLQASLSNGSLPFSFNIIQRMSDSRLSGIESVGLRLWLPHD